MKMRNLCWLIAGIIITISSYGYAQTMLFPGDLAVISINTSNGDCSGNSGEDLISFVCLKDLQTGTTIDLTDNGWERLNPNSFGNSEGILRLERTGAILPAGTIITLRTQGVGGNYDIISPDTAWAITHLNSLGNNLNLNTGGDQLIFMQGGTWDDGSSTGFGGFSHDAIYTGGRFLFAFNTNNQWNTFQDSSRESGLPPPLQTCGNQIANHNPTDYLAYIGPLEAASPIEWYLRLSDPDLWQSYSSCSAIPGSPQNIAVLGNTPGIDCRDCSSCEPYEEDLYFRLPNTAGPFDIVYTQNQDTLVLNNVNANDSLSTTITENTRVELISLTNSSGCPFYPARNNGFEALIEPISYRYQLNGSACDTSCYTIDFTFEGNGPFLLRYYFSHQDSSAARNLIALTNERSLDICPSELPDDQGPIELILLSLKDLNCTTPINERLEVARGGLQAFDLMETLCENESRIVNNTIYDINNPRGQEVIPGGATNGCDSIIHVDLSFTPALTASLSGDATICAGESTLLTLNLTGADSYTVEIQDDQAGLLFFTNISDGAQIEVAPVQTTTYTLISVAADNASCGSQADQSVTVAVSDLSLELRPTIDYNGFDLSCTDASDGGLSVQTEGGTAPFQINWSTGETTANLNNLAAGTYAVSVEDDAGCRQNASYPLNVPPPLQVQLGRDSAGCEGSTTALKIDQINGGVGPYEYSLDGQFFASISALPFTSGQLDAGSYDLVIQDMNDCRIARNFQIGTGNQLAFDLGPDITIASGDSTIIETDPIEPPLNANWINAEAATFLSDFRIRVQPERTQTYGLRLQYSDGCIVEDYLTVFVEETKDYYTPNAFSPNEDGMNDRFTIFGNNRIRQINYLQVFSRWGQLVFEQRDLAPNDAFQGWDGTYRGQASETGTYLFSAELEYPDGRREVVSGSFLLLR